MDAMVSYHGFQTRNSTLEVFYFTREYGMTRWEVWTPATSLPKPTPTSECAVSKTPRYNGVTYVITGCHDWSRLNTPLPTAPDVPIWPIPNISLLQAAQNPHFIGTVAPWLAPPPVIAAAKIST